VANATLARCQHRPAAADSTEPAADVTAACSANKRRMCFESCSGCDPPGIQGGINLFEVQ
jgi:hypothetical protein